MKMNLTGAIEILKQHKHTTDKFKHSIGDKYVSDAIDTVIEALEKPLPTNEDVETWNAAIDAAAENAEAYRGLVDKQSILKLKKMNLQKAVEVLKLLRKSIKQGGELPTIFKEHTDAIDTVVAELEKPTYTVEDMKSAWESGCLVGCEQENDIIYNREKSNYLTFERWIEGRGRNEPNCL